MRERETEMKSHQTKQDLTQLNTPYAVYARARIQILFIEYFQEAFLSHLLKRKHQVEVVRR